MDSFSMMISTLEKFNIDEPDNWKQWLSRWDALMLATELDTKSEPRKLSTFVLWLGTGAQSLIDSLEMTSTERENYIVVRTKLDEYFTGNLNSTLAWHKFFTRQQHEGEPVDKFIRDLHKLSDGLEFGALKDKLILHRIIAGINDISLSSKLQLKANLTLKDAKSMVRQAEIIKTQPLNPQQPALQDIASVASGSHFNDQQKNNRHFLPARKTATSSRFQRSRRHANIECYKCGRTGHIQRNCPGSGRGNQRRIHTVEEEAESAVNEGKLIDNVIFTSGAWYINMPIGINKQLIRWKLEIGAQSSIIPLSLAKKCNITITPCAQKFITANGSHVIPVGMFSHKLCYKNVSIIAPIYVFDNASEPLLGIKEINNLGIITKESVMAINNMPSTVYNASLGSTTSLFKCIDNNASRCNADYVAIIVDRFPQLFHKLGTVKAEYDITLKPDATPVAIQNPRGIPHKLKEKVNNELNNMHDLNVISPVDFPTDWCSPLVVVIKKDGTIRLCIDFIRLNEAVCCERYPLPSTDYILACLGNAKVYSKIDFNSAYWQVPLSERSRLLTTFLTPNGRFCFNRLPYGISSATEFFQKLVASTLAGIEGVVCLLDDVLIFAANKTEHDLILDKVLRKLVEAGITLNKNKCIFGASQVTFLGHIVSQNGISADPEKVRSITQMPSPKDVHELRRYLGLCNYLSKFVPHFADIAKPLRRLTKKAEPWCWGDEQSKAFKELNSLCSSNKVLAKYDHKKEHLLSSDASKYGLGAALFQKENGQWRPVAYASRTLTATEQNYAQIEKEGLGVVYACKKFHSYVAGKTFTIQTDHAPLISIFSKKQLDQLSPRLQRFRMHLMEFSYNIVHVPGKSLVVSDTLSRAPIDSPITADEHEATAATNNMVFAISRTGAPHNMLLRIKEASKEDPIFNKILEFCQDSWPPDRQVSGDLRPYFSLRHELTVSDGIILRGSRLVIPPVMRMEILNKIHSGHLGISKCRQRAQESVWWPGLSSQIQEMVKSCNICVKDSRMQREPMIPISKPSRPWEKIATDLFYFQNKVYIVVVDCFSSFIECAQIRDSKTAATTQFLSSLFARYGYPNKIASDNGPAYASYVFKQFCNQFGFKIQHITSSPAYPQSNGKSENGVKITKHLLIRNEGDLHRGLMIYNATPLSHGLSPAQMFLGRRIQTDLPVSPSLLMPAWPNFDKVGQVMEQQQIKQKVNFDRRHNAKNLKPIKPQTQVFVRTSEGKKRYPGIVIEQSTARPRSYQVKTSKGIINRNRADLIPLPRRDKTLNDSVYYPMDLDDFECPTTVVSNHSNNRPQSRNDVSVPLIRNNLTQTQLQTRSTVTRAGRISHPPTRLIQVI